MKKLIILLLLSLGLFYCWGNQKNFFSCKGSISFSFSNDTNKPNYSLSLSCEEGKYFEKSSNYKKYIYVAGSETITINYQYALVSGGGGSQSGGTAGGHCRTILSINGKETQEKTIKINKSNAIKSLVTITLEKETSTSTEKDMLANIIIDFDENAPTIHAKSNVSIFDNLSDNQIFTQTVSLTSSDDKSDCNLTIKKGQETISGSTISSDGIYTIIAKDNVGNTNRKTLIKDSTKPKIELKSLDGTVIGYKEWINQDLKVLINDDTSGIKTKKIKNDEGEKEIAGNELLINKNGIYTISATDNAGFTSTIEIKIDKELPQIEKDDLIFYKENNSRLINKIDIVIKEIKDIFSGLQEVSIFDNEKTIEAITDLNNCNSFSKIVSKSTIDRSIFQSYNFKIEAKDYAGNLNSTELKTVNLPPEIVLEKLETEIVKEEDNQKTKTVTKLKLKNYHEYAEYYEELKIKRTIYIGNEEVTEDNYEKYFDNIPKETWKTFTNWHEINKNDIKEKDNFSFIEDQIPTACGLGHKKTGYIIKWKLHDFSGLEEVIWEESNELKVITADSPTKVNIIIQGKDDNKFLTADVFSDQINDSLELAPDGSIKIGIELEDEDYELQQIELRHMIGENLSIAKEGFIQKGVTGNAKAIEIDYKNNYKKGECYWFETPEYLSFNKTTHLFLKIKSGYNESQSIIDSKIICLKAKPVANGGFILYVSENAEYNHTGITANPNQLITLELQSENETDNNITWDFGDEKKEYNKSLVTHQWAQLSNRQGNTSDYFLTITDNNTTIITINVHIIDTQIGTLYGDEIWYGKHEVLGKIVIPKDKSLIIKDIYGKEKTEILCIGSEEEQYMGCFEVYGTLIIDSSRNETERIRIVCGENTEKGIQEIKEIQENNLYWKGIEIRNSDDNNITEQIKVKGIEISGSLRGIAIDNHRKAKIENSLFQNNIIGLHIFGECISEKIIVKDNVEYGIKEENGCNVKIKKSEIKNNTVDWYDKKEGPLNKDEITKKMSN